MDQSTPATASFCPRCGTSVGANDRFCRGCALDLTAAAVPADPAAAEPAPRAGWADEPAYQSVPGAPAAPAPFAYAAPAAEPAAAPAAAAKPGGNTGKIVAAVLAVAVIVVVVLVLSGVLKTPLTTHAVSGTFVIKGDTTSISVSGGTCSGDGGYSDIQPGQPLTVKDEKGTILDATTLGTGSGTAFTGCTFDFTVHVPDAAQFYVFTMGRRGDVTFSHADMVANGWTVGLSIGK